ncbi:MAG: aminotransferase class V-fold PLP-dependent enzyme [Candidatus Competibacter sp.]|nr:aminotransferase class V-fold PLP-dependent enzyme [Candidatus Competibacter sp.]
MRGKANSSESQFSRRDFLKGAAATAAVGMIDPAKVLAGQESSNNSHSDFPEQLRPHPVIGGNPSSESYWRNVRRAFVLPDDYIHMNTGTTGSQPLFALNNLAVYNLYKSMDPRDWEKNLNAAYPDLFPLASGLFGPSGTTARQQAVAGVYGANPDEIVLSYNTTDACNLIFAGTPWNKGDRIITTSFEHPALAGPIAWARDYHGVKVVVIDIPSNFKKNRTVDEVLDWFEKALGKPLDSGKKQYVAFSEIFYKNGLRMPVKEICALAREYGAYSIVDTAHGWGMLPIDCHDYGADFIAGAGHKWLCGGPGTGICYVRTSGGNLPPFAMGNFFLYGNLFVVPSSFFENRTWVPAAYMQFRGESNTPALYAMTDSLSFFDYLGVENIYNRGVALGNYLKNKIADQWGAKALWVQENPDSRFATALTSFNPFAGRDDSSQFSVLNTAISTIITALAAETPKIYIRSVTWRDKQTDSADNRVGFRISTHGVYNSYAEIDYVFGRLVDRINASGLPQLS